MFDFPNSPSVGAIYTPAGGGPTYQWNGTAWMQVVVPLTAVPQGQCYLDVVSGVMTLSPFNGNQLWINGVNRTIPPGGVTLAPTGLIGSTLFLYAYWTGSAIALEAVTTGTALDAASGMRVKSGDATRTFVGVHNMQVSGSWNTSAVATSSWFNPRTKISISGTPANPATASTGYIELSSTLRVPIAHCFGRWASCTFQATVMCSLATADAYTTLGVDGANGILAGVRTTRNQAAPGSQQAPMFIAGGYGGAEGSHFITAIGAASSTNTATWGSCWTEVTIQG